jgi:hypothetical protein
LPILRRLKASQFQCLFDDASMTKKAFLMPHEVHMFHYRSYMAFIMSIVDTFMSSSSDRFSMEYFQTLLDDIEALLPPLDYKLLERTIPLIYLDKLSVTSVRAAAICGRHEKVLTTLRTLEAQYAGRSAILPKTVYEAALEGTSVFYHHLTMLSERQILRRTQV